jgi:ribosome-binding factor A
MNSRRVAKASEAVRETVSTVVLFELRDPRVKNVTVLSAEVSADLRAAKVYVSIMGDAKAQSLCMHGLNSARGFIQSRVADRLQTKNTPILKFMLDPSVKLSIEVSRALMEAKQRDSDQTSAPNESEDLEEDELDYEEFDDEDLTGIEARAADESDADANRHTESNDRQES